MQFLGRFVFALILKCEPQTVDVGQRIRMFLPQYFLPVAQRLSKQLFGRFVSALTAKHKPQNAEAPDRIRMVFP